MRTILGLHLERDILEYAANASGPHIPAFIALTRAIAARCGILVSDGVALQMVPVAGATSGALINYPFMQHFQDVATGHFAIRRLERKYGSETIRDICETLAEEEREAEKAYSPVVGW